MKTEGEITQRIKALGEMLKKNDQRRKSYSREHGARTGTLGIKRIREIEGEIMGLLWVLEPGAHI